MKNLMKSLVNSSKLMASIKEQTLYASLKLADAVLESELRINPELTYEQQTKIRSNAQIDGLVNLMKSASNYLLETDSILITKTNIKQTGIEIVSVVTRDGSEFGFITEMIFAGGYNIQKLHVRYTVKTNLKKIGAGSKSIEQRVSRSETIIRNIRTLRHAYMNYEEEMLEALVCGDDNSRKRLEKEMNNFLKQIEKLQAKLKEENSK